MSVNIFHRDCMEAMAEMKDKSFDLAIVDPPYGIGASFGVGGTRGKEGINYTKKDWDLQRPKKDYFMELDRVSKNQIVFGGNYFADLLIPSRGWVYWRKEMGGNYADGELAWTSFDVNLKEFTKRSESFFRIHPTQKPVKLYEWLLKNYAKPGDKILDTHGGSCSIAIACYNLDFDLTCFEIDAEYHGKAVQRLEEHRKQGRLFEAVGCSPAEI